MIFGFCYKIMSFRDLSKPLTFALKSSRSNSQHPETHLCHFTKKFIHIHNVAMKIS